MIRNKEQLYSITVLFFRYLSYGHCCELWLNIKDNVVLILCVLKNVKHLLHNVYKRLLVN